MNVPVANNIISLLALGFALGIDSWRASVGLGSVNRDHLRQFRLALTFGVFDAITPLIGLILGHSLLGLVGSWLQYLGPICLAAYGVYVIYFSRRTSTELTDVNQKWIIFGLPLSLSLDNLVAGTGLGLLDFSPIASAAILGLISGLMSWFGLRVGSILIDKLPIRAHLIAGVTLIVVALSLIIDLR